MYRPVTFIHARNTQGRLKSVAAHPGVTDPAVMPVR